MKKIVILGMVALVLVMALAVATPALAGNGGKCATIKDGTILDSIGETVVLGYDQFGYNYQAHIFNGRYCDSDRVEGGPYCDVSLVMKWNDAWLSNKDCDDDDLLDRPDNYIGSGAWLTNHQYGSYIEDGEEHHWSYFTKIVAAPADATLVDGIWYTADGAEIGPAIWGAFATILSVYNDPYEGYYGIEYLSSAPAGFGFYAP